MGERVKELVQGQCLHDAVVLSLQENLADLPFFLPFKTSVTILSLRIDKRIIDIIYLTWAEIGQSAAPSGWPFSKLRPHWLYEEIDFEPRSVADSSLLAPNLVERWSGDFHPVL